MSRAMTREILAGVPEALWQRVAGASSRLLMLDYDGTLAPFEERRDEARPLPGAIELLERVSAGAGTIVAVISGRHLDELERRLGRLPIQIVGEHGWEARRPDGRRVTHEPPEGCRAALERAAQAAAARGWARRLERKRTAVAVHTRGLPASEAEEMEETCRRLWEPEARGGVLRLRGMNGGVEIGAAGRDKATAVRDLVRELPAGAPAVYVGDDETDEDAFRELRGSGFGVRVGHSGRPTLASGEIPSPGAVLLFLDRWLEAALEERKGGRA